MTSMWSPTKTRLDSSNVAAFIKKLAAKTTSAHSVKDFDTLYSWSVEHPEEFWEQVWDFLDVIGSKGPGPFLVSQEDILNAQWFPKATLNFAENLLREKTNRPAVVFYGEDKVQRTLSFNELRREVTRLAHFFLQQGIKKGDVVAGLVPNCPEAIISMLATVSIGGVWTSCSPDFGATGIIDRFGQTEPKILITTDGYYYRGSTFSLGEKVCEISKAIPSIKKIVFTLYTGSPLPLELRGITNKWEELPASSAPLQFTQVPFNHPLFIMYSSGTTGKPKCIIHSVGGTLLEHLKEHVLHVDLKKSDSIIYQTTCGWMMWNWLVSALATGATVVLYDGYPLLNNGNALFDIIDKERITVFGTNAKFIASLEKEGIKPNKSHSLDTLHTILSTGSPLLPESFDYVYRDIKKDICLSSISGGTDILGCFALGSPTLPVHRGEVQTRSLGLNVQVWNESGESVVGERGELVCTAPFPSQPIGFWNDPSKERYKAAYFSHFPNIWYHGDFVELTKNNGMIFYGRSDAVLNPGGIRIGTAEIYRQVEQLTEIQESIVIGQEWDNDVRVILFVKLCDGVSLTPELEEKIRKHIRANASPFHVPKKIIAVPDIPRTRSGKIVELTVRDVIHGRAVKNTEALMNPEALEFFRGIPQLLN